MLLVTIHPYYLEWTAVVPIPIPVDSFPSLVPYCPLPASLSGLVHNSTNRRRASWFLDWFVESRGTINDW